VQLFSIRNGKPTDVTVSILFIYRRISTCFGPTGPSSGELTQLFPQPLVQYPYRSDRVFCMYTWPERYGYWTIGCGNSCVNSHEDGPVGPKHVEIRRYMNKIETVTSVGFSFLIPQGRPKYRWEDNIKQDICQLEIKNWIACVQDRGKWKEVVEKAKTFN